MEVLSIVLILVIILLGVGASFAYFAWQKEKQSSNSKTKENESSGIGDRLLGICEVAIETASLKEERKQKIIELLKADGLVNGGLSNLEIRKALGVSSRTAVRYMDELEKEGRVEQVGKTGQNVTYRVKQ
ncbi:MAG: winged helix-turn-helix transcriptional regulator [Candidatus Staskawiczbacteria bacterium]|nr:winged helix-turn-helix transcriptional regulator [Candidatus Staskawiczbacteria bacterium]